MHTFIRRLVVVLVLFLVCLEAWQLFVHLPFWRLSDVHVTGNLYWTQETLLADIKVPQKKSILLIDTADLKKQMSLLPQVKAVKVYRKLPSTLVFDIVERTPWARTMVNSETLIIDRDGKILNVTGVQVITTDKLIELKGITTIKDLEPFTKKFKYSLEKIKAVFPDQPIEVTAIGPYEINVRINKQLLIIWGTEDNVDEKAKIVKAILPVIQGQWSSIGYIDTRSPKNLAIRYLSR